MKNIASVCHEEKQYCTGKSKRASPQNIPAVPRTPRRLAPVARNVLGQQTHAELLPALQCVTRSLSEYFRLAKGKSGLHVGCGGAGMEFIKKAAPTLEVFKAMNFGRLSSWTEISHAHAAAHQRELHVLGAANRRNSCEWAPV